MLSCQNEIFTWWRRFGFVWAGRFHLTSVPRLRTFPAFATTSFFSHIYDWNVLFLSEFNPIKLHFYLFSDFAVKLSHCVWLENNAITVKRASLMSKNRKNVRFTTQKFGRIDSCWICTNFFFCIISFPTLLSCNYQAAPLIGFIYQETYFK